MLRNSIESSFFNKTLTNSIILTTFNDFSNWARLSSLWPLLYGTSCCFIEFASLIGSRFDFDCYGLVPRSSPRQADLIITAANMLVNRILKNGKKSLAYRILYKAMKNIQQKNKKNALCVLRQAVRKVTTNVTVKPRASVDPLIKFH
ncbi:hypothetical protein Mapa_012575 [Marchantia paleacea]|nr:hypothetical protein Mapa_012575 [Marchantia paleacea]